MIDTWDVVTAVTNSGAVRGTAALTLLILFGPMSHTTGWAVGKFAMVLGHLVNQAEMMVYIAVRLAIKVLEFVFASNRALRKKQRYAETYEEWYKIAQQLDATQKRRKDFATDLDDWTASRFCWPYLEGLMEDLDTAREENDVPTAVAILQLCLRKNVGGIFSAELYSQLHTGEPKEIVKDFVEAVVNTLKWVTANADPEEKELVRELLRRAVSTYGRTALCMSGGAMIGCYHLGIVKAFMAEGVLPKIISGSSMGSVWAAFTCVRTDEEVKRDLKAEILPDKMKRLDVDWPERMRRLAKEGAFFRHEEWLEQIDWITCGSLTFLEAFKKTGRILNISLSTIAAKSPPILLNYITAPDILIKSAVICSASAPGLLNPGYLRSKKPDGSIEVLKEQYFDGSMEQDIPKDGLAEQMNCQFFVVVQVNPHLIPFQFSADGTPGNPTPWFSPRGGHLLAGLELYLKMDMKNRFAFLNKVGAHVGGLSQLFTQDLSGTINVTPPVVLQDFPKAVMMPDESDMKRYIQGGLYTAFGNIAMISTHEKIAKAIDECREKLKMPADSELDEEVVKLLRPTVVGDDANSMGRRTVRHTMRRKTIRKTVNFKGDAPTLKDEDNSDGDDEWVPLKYNTRGSLWQGTVATPKGSY